MGLPDGVRLEPLSRATVRGAIAVKNAGWRDTYLPWLGGGYLDRLDASLEEAAARWISALDAGTLLPTWVALDADGAVVGVSAGGPIALTQAVHRPLAGGAAGLDVELGAGAGADGVDPDGVDPESVGADGGDAEASGTASRRPITHELAMLYVSAAWRGRGIAEELSARAVGDEPAFLWVLEENPRARGFYAKLGFEADGAVQDLPADWNGAREVRMVRW